MMSGIRRTIKKAIPKEATDPMRFAKALKKELIPEIPKPEQPRDIPMSDEDEIKRNRRRSQSTRGGGRASTILSDGDRLGP